MGLGHVGSGASWHQSVWLAGAMTPLSVVALLIASQFAVASPATGYLIARIALPAILLMEVCGAVLVSLALYRVGEGSRPWLPDAAHPGAAPNPSDAPRTGDTP